MAFAYGFSFNLILRFFREFFFRILQLILCGAFQILLRFEPRIFTWGNCSYYEGGILMPSAMQII